MSENIIISLITLAGTMITAYASIKKFNNLTDYKIKALTKSTDYKIDELKNKMEKHNNLIERTYCNERNICLLKEKISVANHRIDDLESNQN